MNPVELAIRARTAPTSAATWRCRRRPPSEASVPRPAPRRAAVAHPARGPRSPRPPRRGGLEPRTEGRSQRQAVPDVCSGLPYRSSPRSARYVAPTPIVRRRALWRRSGRGGPQRGAASVHSRISRSICAAGSGRRTGSPGPCGTPLSGGQRAAPRSPRLPRRRPARRLSPSATRAPAMEPAAVTVSSAATNDLSIFNRSTGKAWSRPNDEWPIPKSSVTTETPSARTSPQHRGRLTGAGDRAGLGDLDLQRARLDAGRSRARGDRPRDVARGQPARRDVHRRPQRRQPGFNLQVMTNTRPLTQQLALTAATPRGYWLARNRASRVRDSWLGPMAQGDFALRSRAGRTGHRRCPCTAADGDPPLPALDRLPSGPTPARMGTRLPRAGWIDLACDCGNTRRAMPGTGQLDVARPMTTRCRSRIA
jgi:hypothetical protein